MNYSKRKTLVVVGAGPKGIAVAVKAKVLEECGFPVDRVIVIEKHGVAAHWSGEFGFTNGDLSLGTLPEKDVVYPLETDVGDEKLNALIRQRLMHYSWISFLIHTGQYSEWVDRGRHAPSHKLWSEYLQWVASQLAPQVSIIVAQVITIDLSSDEKQWKLLLEDQSEHKIQYSLSADRLMLTGPGKPRMDFLEHPNDPLPPCVYDLVTFWSSLKSDAFKSTDKLAIIGAGENAASALLALKDKLPALKADIISPRGFISSRAEGYYENKMFSSPDNSSWQNLALADRRDFIERTDLGVFSVHAMSILSEQASHQIIPGRVNNLKYDGSKIIVELKYHEQRTIHQYDKIVLATGFDYVSTLRSIFSIKAFSLIEQSINTQITNEALSKNIQADLSLKGVFPYLHIPMLAGLMQGPGFANLSCLGLLSDRVVTHFTRKFAIMNSKHKNIEYLLEAN